MIVVYTRYRIASLLNLIAEKIAPSVSPTHRMIELADLSEAEQALVVYQAQIAAIAREN